MGRNTRGDTTAPHNRSCAMTCAIIVAWLVLLVIAGESFVLLNLTVSLTIPRTQITGDYAIILIRRFYCDLQVPANPLYLPHHSLLPFYRHFIPPLCYPRETSPFILLDSLCYVDPTLYPDVMSTLSSAGRLLKPGCVLEAALNPLFYFARPKWHRVSNLKLISVLYDPSTAILLWPLSTVKSKACGGLFDHLAYRVFKDFLCWWQSDEIWRCSGYLQKLGKMMWVERLTDQVVKLWIPGLDFTAGKYFRSVACKVSEVFIDKPVSLSKINNRDYRHKNGTIRSYDNIIS